MKCAVIGVGNMGKNHLRTLSEIDEVKLVGIADLNEKLGQDLADKFSCKYYSDYKRLIEVEKPEIVSICVPTSLHHKVGLYCIGQGINVLLEKPISIEIEHGEELINASKKKGVKLLVGHIERFNPVVQKTKKLIQKGELGQITSITARRVGGFPPQIKDANIAVDLAIHDIDIINYLLDSLPDQIYSNKQKHHIE
ncbi:gfo/Idh/MocA family oxidoreductase, partial [Candidatus Peregrinibacteria bacterium]|nr:gfo/Idh/MocA family oxidoreductase [Candidatus Peregrinibacteria bacterium]